jgi:cytochrome c biogenesis protein CcmG, thiol:disulfide interchange protein DsbE
MDTDTPDSAPRLPEPAPARNRLPLLILLLGAILFGLGAGLTVMSYSQKQSRIGSIPAAQGADVRIGGTAPDFTLTSLDGAQSVTLSALRGKRVLINFWASWCPPCIAETPDLIEAHRALNDPNIVFIGIGVQDSTENLRKFAEINKMTYLVVEDIDGRVADAFGLRGMPMSLIIDERGAIQKQWLGPVTKDQVLAEFAK